MDDLQFYLVNEYCPRCNSVTTHDVFEVNTDNEKAGTVVRAVNSGPPYSVHEICKDIPFHSSNRKEFEVGI